MVEHESHALAMAVDSGDALVENRDQILEGLEQHVGQNGPLEMTPQPLDQVQTWAVGRQPALGDLSDRVAAVRHRNNQAVAEHVGRRCLEPRQVDQFELFVSPTDTSALGTLLAIELPG